MKPKKNKDVEPPVDPLPTHQWVSITVDKDGLWQVDFDETMREYEVKGLLMEVLDDIRFGNYFGVGFESDGDE